MQTGPQTNLGSAAADAVLAAKGRSFHWARRLLGQQHAQRATRLYQLCRYIDDVADEADSIELSKTGLLKIRQAAQSGQITDPILIDGLQLIHECRVDIIVLLDLIDGVESDTDPVRIPDEAALLRYCYQVAGTVGLMMCKVLDCNDDIALPFAIDLGIAMQLTNICRDIQTDALLNRRYVPASLIPDIAPHTLADPPSSRQIEIAGAVSQLLARAEQYYASGEQGLCYLPWRARISILVAARVYREIGRQLKKNNCIYWHQRIVVSTPRKLLITVQAVVTMIWRPSFWRSSKQHDSRLHQALRSFGNRTASHV